MHMRHSFGFLGFCFAKYDGTERLQKTVQYEGCVISSVNDKKYTAGIADEIGSPFTADSFGESFVGWHPEATWSKA